MWRLIVDDDRLFAHRLRADAERLGSLSRTIHGPANFGPVLISWQPSIIAMDLAVPDADALELISACAGYEFNGYPMI